MSGHHNFDELEAKTPREKALADVYERLTRAVMRLAELRAQRGWSEHDDFMPQSQQFADIAA